MADQPTPVREDGTGEDEPGEDVGGSPSTASPWGAWLDDEERRIHAAGQWRLLRPLDAAGPAGVLVGTGQPVVSFAANDYLGLTQHPAVKQAATAAIDRWGTGAGASRLVVGTRPAHTDLEHELARWRGTEAALVLASGYAANTGVLGVLGGPGVHIHSDALNHASVVDGCRLAAGRGADIHVYPHLDLDRLTRELAAGARAGATRQVVVSDTVFSMDGDVAPVAELGALCARHGALLVLDDAHVVLDVPAVPAGAAVVRVGTLSKALGSLGGFVAASRRFVDLLVNRARPFIFSTALSPADAAAAHAALDVARSAEGDALRARLRGHVDRIRPGHPTPIVPVVVGDERAALAASAELLDQGLLVPAIRPPTVPPGTSRLRVALSAAHTDDQVDRLRVALGALAPRGPAGTRGDGGDRAGPDGEGS